MRFSASSLFITLCISFLLILLLDILLSYKKSYKLFRTDFITEIMDILWKHDIAMSANDIKLAFKNLSINTIQQTLQKLLEIKYIKVAGIGQNKKAITRLYRPVISEAQYVNSFIGEDTRAKISAYFVEHTNDLEMIEQLKKLIQEKEKELK